MDTYTVELDHAEGSTLRWLADRYNSAGHLYDHGRYVEDAENEDSYAQVIKLDETQAAVYLAHLVTENGNPGQTLPTCAGGSLAVKLQSLYDEIAHDLRAGD